VARFQLRAAHYKGSVRLKAGTVITDGVGGQAGDYLWSGLSSANITPDMAPLDAGANTMKSGSVYANVGVPATCTGVGSIDG